MASFHLGALKGLGTPWLLEFLKLQKLQAEPPGHEASLLEESGQLSLLTSGLPESSAGSLALDPLVSSLSVQYFLYFSMGDTNPVSVCSAGP